MLLIVKDRGGSQNDSEDRKLKVLDGDLGITD